MAAGDDVPLVGRDGRAGGAGAGGASQPAAHARAGDARYRSRAHHLRGRREPAAACRRPAALGPAGRRGRRLFHRRRSAHARAGPAGAAPGGDGAPLRAAGRERGAGGRADRKRPRPRRAHRPGAAAGASPPRGGHPRQRRRGRLRRRRAARPGGRQLRRRRHLPGRRPVRPGEGRTLAQALQLGAEQAALAVTWRGAYPPRTGRSSW